MTLKGYQIVTENEAIKIESHFASLGYNKTSPNGYVNYYNTFHYKAYWMGADGSFWVVEGLDAGSNQYIVDQLS